jgi:hypothetical protein
MNWDPPHDQVISLFRAHFDKFFASMRVRNRDLHTTDTQTNIQVYEVSESESWGLLHLNRSHVISVKRP